MKLLQVFILIVLSSSNQIYSSRSYDEIEILRTQIIKTTVIGFDPSNLVARLLAENPDYATNIPFCQNLSLYQFLQRHRCRRSIENITRVALERQRTHIAAVLEQPRTQTPITREEPGAQTTSTQRNSRYNRLICAFTCPSTGCSGTCCHSSAPTTQ